MQITIDFSPFLAIAVGIANNEVKRTVDEIYKEKKIEYYDLPAKGFLIH